MKNIGISFMAGLCMAILLCASFASLAYTPPSLPPPSKTVYQLIEQNKNLSKFLAMIDDAGLKQLLSTNAGEPVTVFAPANAALEDIPDPVMERIKANLPSFVKYHIIAGSMVSSGAIKGRRASPATANGETLPFDGTDRTKAAKVGDGTLVQSDIMATNGIVQIVSGALIPASLGQPSAPPPAPKPPAMVAAPATSAPASAPAAAVQTNIPASSTPAATTTTAAAASTSTASSAVRITTSGVAKAPGAKTKSVTSGSSSATVTTKGVAKAPAAATEPTPAVIETMTTGVPAASLSTSGLVAPPLPETTSALPVPPPPSALPETTSSSGGFELFGHKFGW